jgi:hypothetical protein
MTTDVDRLLAKFESGALLRPNSTPSLVDLAAAFWSAAGVPEIELTAAAAGFRERIGEASHLVLVIADGLGFDILEAMPAAAFLWQRLAATLQTVFPSTTAVALTSIYTAAWPAAHGVTGHWMQLPRAGAITVLPYTTRTDRRPLPEVGVEQHEVFPLPSLLGRVPRETLLLLPSSITESGTSRYMAGGAAIRGYRSLAEACDIVGTFSADASGPTCCVLYTPRIDDAAHEHGPAHIEVVGAVRALDEQIARLAASLAGRARTVVTADHGHLAVPLGGRRVLRADDDAGRMLRAAPAGDARVLNFFVQPGAADEFAAAFRTRFGEQFVLLTPDEVASLHLLGPNLLAAQTRDRLGDFVAIALGADVLEYRAAGASVDRRLSMRSHHSGLTAAETRVPFVLV